MNHTEVEIDRSALQEFVIAFAREMNEWESAFYLEWMAHLDSCPNEATPEAMSEYNARDLAMQSQHRARYSEIFARYCTLRKRIHGGPEAPLKAGSPTKYSGVDRATFINVDLINNKRAVIAFQTNGPVVNYLFHFVLLKTTAGWRIDGYKYQFKGEAKWNTGIL